MADMLVQDMARRIAELEAEKDDSYFSRPRVDEEHWRAAVGATLNLAGLRGAWSMASVGVSGQAIDMQGLGNHLTNNNSADFGYDNLVAYCNYDGANQYHSITDAASSNAFDILGTEAFIESAAQGLTVGGWFQFDDGTPAANELLIAKWIVGVGVNRSYLLQRLSATTIRFQIYDGAAVTTATTTATTTTATWYHLCGKFDTTSGDVFVYLNGVESVTAAAVASINNSAADLVIGAGSAGTLPVDGRASLCWVCTESLSAATIMAHYQNTRAAYGVIV